MRKMKTTKNSTIAKACNKFNFGIGLAWICIGMINSDLLMSILGLVWMFMGAYLWSVEDEK